MRGARTYTRRPPTTRDDVGDATDHHALVRMVVPTQHKGHAVPAKKRYEQALLDEAGLVEAGRVRRLVHGDDLHQLARRPQRALQERALGG